MTVLRQISMAMTTKYTFPKLEFTLSLLAQRNPPSTREESQRLTFQRRLQPSPLYFNRVLADTIVPASTELSWF